ncbi:hypothetical protein SNE_A00260 [Simkania negevensis Z]|uniref:Uncharacterized protein n=2 Tax=Simkania negevensis TaxID=83561 RepID=F8L523_SIMNZ|nr:hypothetical protein SNE_A00260 [Simkania negevensis Z]
MRLFLLSFLLVVDFLTNLNAQETDVGESVAARVKLILPEDRKILSRFFKRLFYHGDFSYTLLGQKPMGSIDYNLNLLAFPQFYKEPQKHLFMMALDEKGWKIWEKYKNLFLLRKYSFIKVKHESFFGFLLINKEKTFEVIKDNLPVFQELVGEEICASKILAMLCDGKFGYYHSNAPSLVTYYKVLGLLYGYGEENVKAFIKREQLIQKLMSFPIEMKSLPSEVMSCLEMEDSPKTLEKIHFQSITEIAPLVSELKNLLDNTCLYSNNFKNWFWATRKLSEFVDFKWPNIRNMRSLKIG